MMLISLKAPRFLAAIGCPKIADDPWVHWVESAADMLPSSDHCHLDPSSAFWYSGYAPAPSSAIVRPITMVCVALSEPSREICRSASRKHKSTPPAPIRSVAAAIACAVSSTNVSRVVSAGSPFARVSTVSRSCSSASSGHTGIATRSIITAAQTTGSTDTTKAAHIWRRPTGDTAPAVDPTTRTAKIPPIEITPPVHPSPYSVSSKPKLVYWVVVHPNLPSSRREMGLAARRITKPRATSNRTR
mmetsp:Transcript_8414/g.21479  ORF Transcript_8414/g.21479 Transcript_8414/m.21479 type:complete len:245 (-) Transcript_8414:75-809(-)